MALNSYFILALMGLDIVGLILRIEEEFEIELEEEDCALISTCGQLCSLVERQAGVFTLEGRCASQQAFYQVRRDLVEMTGVSRRRIGPRTLLHDLIPLENRAVRWNELREKLGLKLPELERPNFIAIPLACWVGFSILSLPFAVTTENRITALGSLIFCFLAYQLTRSLAYQPPALYATVGDLALKKAALSPKLPANDVWPRLQRLIADELSVPLGKVTKDADLIRDLGADWIETVD